jgi:putative transcriptional regulator
MLRRNPDDLNKERAKLSVVSLYSSLDYMSNTQYSTHEIYFASDMPLTSMKIEVPIDRLLTERNKSFYWLAKEAGISYSTLWRLKSGKALGVNFATLVKVCDVLGCGPGDLLVLKKQTIPAI